MWLLLLPSISSSLFLFNFQCFIFIIIILILTITSLWWRSCLEWQAFTIYIRVWFIYVKYLHSQVRLLFCSYCVFFPIYLIFPLRLFRLCFKFFQFLRFCFGVSWCHFFPGGHSVFLSSFLLFLRTCHISEDNNASFYSLALYFIYLAGLLSKKLLLIISCL